MAHEKSISNWSSVMTIVVHKRLRLTNHHVLGLLLIYAFDENLHNSPAGLPGLPADLRR
jgi:hypothetical protein